MINYLATNNWLIIANSLVFLLSPIALIIHLYLSRNKSNLYKKRVGYVYGSLWAIAFIGYVWLFLN